MSAVAAAVVVSDEATARIMQLQEMSEAIQRLEFMVPKLDQDLHSADRKLDNLKQYERRNCLILHGCKTSTLKKERYYEFESFVLNFLIQGDPKKTGPVYLE